MQPNSLRETICQRMVSRSELGCILGLVVLVLVLLGCMCRFQCLGWICRSRGRKNRKRWSLLGCKSERTICLRIDLGERIGLGRRIHLVLLGSLSWCTMARRKLRRLLGW